jgi:hypothetical protein
MKERGEYRTLLVSLADNTAVHALSGDALKLLVMCKLSLPATGIGVFYWSKLQDQMHCDRATIGRLFDELEASRPRPDSERGWLVVDRQRNVVWVVDGLGDEQLLNAANVKKHVPYVRRKVAELDAKLPIVAAFRAYYAEWFGGVPEGNAKGSDTLSDGIPQPSDTQSEMPETKGIDRVSKQKQEEEEQNKTDTTQSSSPSARERLLSLVPERTAWEGELAVAKDGAYGARFKATDEQIETACRDYLGNGNGTKPNLAHFRAHLRRIVTAAPAIATPAKPARATAGSGAPSSDYGKHFQS